MGEHISISIDADVYITCSVLCICPCELYHVMLPCKLFARTVRLPDSKYSQSENAMTRWRSAHYLRHSVLSEL